MAKRKQKKFSDSRNVNTASRSTYPAISVIIPMYNAEKFVAECLDSLLDQTFRDFEVIVVDDCSTDSSAMIVQSYESKFGGRLNFTSLEKNSGSGALPRNKGLMLSRGEYVFFMDADDKFTKTALEEMYTLAKDFDADVVYNEQYYISDPTCENMEIASLQNGDPVENPTLETEDLAERVQGIANYRYYVTPWSKMVRRNLMMEHDIKFPHVKIAEDDIWTYALVIHAKKFLRVPNAVYIWRMAEGTMSRTKKTPQEKINFCLHPIIFGLKALDKMIGTNEFLQENPQYRYAVLERLFNEKFNVILEESFQLPPFAVYESIKQEFGDKMGEQDVLVPALCTYINTLQKFYFVNLQEFNNFAEQTKALIAKLET